MGLTLSAESGVAVTEPVEASLKRVCADGLHHHGTQVPRSS